MLTYSAITLEQFSGLRSKLAGHGLAILGSSGELRKFGAVVDVSFDATSETLTVEIKHAPWGMSREAFTAKLDADIKAAL